MRSCDHNLGGRRQARNSNNDFIVDDPERAVLNTYTLQERDNQHIYDLAELEEVKTILRNSTTSSLNSRLEGISSLSISNACLASIDNTNKKGNPRKRAFDRRMSYEGGAISVSYPRLCSLGSIEEVSHDPAANMFTSVSPRSPINSQIEIEEQEELTAYDMDYSFAAESMLAMFESMSAWNRAKFLRRITSNSTSTERKLLGNAVNQLETDDLIEANTEWMILSGILRYCPTSTLCTLSKINNSWSDLIASDIDAWHQAVHRLKPASCTLAFMNTLLNRLKLPYFPTVEDRKLVVRIHQAALKYETVLRNNWLINSASERRSIQPVDPNDRRGPGQPIIITSLLLDGQGRVLTGADNSMVCIWDPSSGELIKTLVAHTGGVWALSIHEDTLVSGSIDRTAVIWDLKTFTPRNTLIGHNSTVRCIETVLNGSLVITGSRDSTIKVWSRDEGVCIHTLVGHEASVRCLAVWRDEYVVSGSYDNTARVWDPKTGQCINTLLGHTGKIYSIAADDEFVYTGSADSTMKVWNPLSGECIATIDEFKSLVGVMALTDRLVVTGCTGGSIRVVAPKDCANDASEEPPMVIHSELDPSIKPPTDSQFEVVQRIINAHHNSVTTIAANRNVVISGSEQSAKMFDLRTGKLIACIVNDVSMVWRILATDCACYVACQTRQGLSQISFFDFKPTNPQRAQILMEFGLSD